MEKPEEKQVLAVMMPANLRKQDLRKTIKSRKSGDLMRSPMQALVSKRRTATRLYISFVC